MAVSSRITYLGPSYDGQTNRWKITCGECSTPWEPPVTNYRHSTEMCPKCLQRYEVDYKERTVRPVIWKSGRD